MLCIFTYFLAVRHSDLLRLISEQTNLYSYIFATQVISQACEPPFSRRLSSFFVLFSSQVGGAAAAAAAAGRCTTCRPAAAAGWPPSPCAKRQSSRCARPWCHRQSQLRTTAHHDAPCYQISANARVEYQGVLVCCISGITTMFCQDSFCQDSF